MTAVVVGMLVIVVAAVVVLAVVAVPQLREGRRVLTPRGRAQVAQARRSAGRAARQARQVAVDVGQSTREKVVARKDDEDEPGAVQEPQATQQPGATQQPAPEPVAEPAAVPEPTAAPEPAPAAEPAPVADPAPVAEPTPVAEPAPTRDRAPASTPEVVDVREARRPRTRTAEGALAWEQLQPGPRHARG